MRQTLFISYSWTDHLIADKIDNVFKPTGVYIKRDIREVKYKGSIKDYMKQIRDTDFVLIVISDNFLKSSNCMFEVLELLKEKDFENKILPILTDETRIFKPSEKIAYIKYWSDKHSELQYLLKTVNTTDALSLYSELKHTENIRTSIDEFLSLLSSMKADTFSECASQNFKSIFDYVGVSDKILLRKILSIKDLEKIEDKEIELDKIENEYPNNPKIYIAKAIYSFNENKITKSNYFYRKAIELDPNFSPAYYNLAYNIEVYEQNFDEAESLYKKAIEIDPADTHSLNNLAGLYSKELDRPEDAKRLYEDALKFDPFNAIAHFNIASLLHEKFKEYYEAKIHYEIALKLDKDFVAAKHNYAILLWKHFEDIKEAKRQFLEVLELEQNKKRTLEQLAMLLETKFKDYINAKIYYDRFILIEPNDAEDHYSYGTFLMLYFLPEFKEIARQNYESACFLDKKYISQHVEDLLYS